jgi:hypothetical protein
MTVRWPKGVAVVLAVVAVGAIGAREWARRAADEAAKVQAPTDPFLAWPAAVKVMSADGVVRIVGRDADDRQIEIMDGPGGIEMTVTDAAGKPMTYRAKDAAGLEKEHPDAYQIYKQFSVYKQSNELPQ